MNRALSILLLLPLCAMGGLEFDGTDDTVILATTGSTTFDTMGTMTVAMWVYPHTAGGNNSGNFMNKLWTFQFNGSGRPIRFLHGTSGTSVQRVSNSAAVALNTWQHVAVTWDGSLTAANIHLYVNGVEVSYATTTDGTGTLNSDAASALYLSTTGSGDYDGEVSDVGVWTTELTAAEIFLLASSRTKRMPLQIQPASLLGYWPLDDVVEGAAADTATMRDHVGANHGDPDNGGNNTGMTGTGETYVSYP